MPSLGYSRFGYRLTYHSVVRTFPRTQGKTVEAEALYQRSLAILENALGTHHLVVGETLALWAMLYLRQVRLFVASTHSA